MRRAIFIFMLLVFCVHVLPVCSSADNNGEPPLTLLRPGQKNGQQAQNQSLPINNGELHDIKGPVTLSEQPPYLLIFGGLGFLLLAAALLYWFLRKKGTPQEVIISPWEKALTELSDAQKLLTPEKGLLYMDRVSQILRSYIESRFAIQSTRQTTREFLKKLAAVDNSSFLQAYRTELKDCLEQADMAKFAHHQPKLDNLRQMEVAVTTFIKKTEPTKQQAPAGSKSTKPAKRGR